MTFPAPAKARRAALIVFHGIGEQDPYQPLDAFVRGLRAVLRLPKGSLQHQLFWTDGKAVTAIRLRLNPPAAAGLAELDVSEFYWAPMVQGRIGVRQVLTWLFQTGIRPLFRWADQPGLLRPSSMTGAQQAWVFTKTLARSLFLLVLAVGLVAPFLYAGLNRQAIIEDVKTLIWPSLMAVLTPWWVALSAGILVFVAVCLLLSGWELLRGPRDAKHALNRTESHCWGLASAALGTAAAMAAVWLLSTSGALPRITDLVTAVTASDLALPLAILGLSLLASVPLVRVVGDVPLYVTQNERSAHYKTRQEILEESAKRLKALLVDDQYQSVYVAGHSLGSVIGYDTINCMAREARSALAAAPAPPANGSSSLTRDQFDKLGGLLTFGSPLDKVYYFFRTRIKDDEQVRAQLESSLHGFRRESSGRMYGDCTIDYEIPEPKTFTWVNVHGRMDFVAAHLDYYRVDGKQPCLPYLNPLTAHTKYWNDHEKFYPEVARWLGLAVAKPEDSTLVTWIKKIPRISRRSLQALLRQEE